MVSHLPMRVLHGVENLQPGERPRAICVGAFDGFHLGHQYLLNRLCSLARERDYDSGIVTFEPAPAQFFSPPDAPPMRLITLAERVALAEALCCDLMAVLAFDMEFAAWSAALFIERVLANGLGTRLLVASSTHTMGHDRADITEITALCERHGIEVVQPPIMQLEDLRVSSTEIRHLLWDGRIEDANTMLGRHYSFAGPVVPGRGLGRQLGFRTANVVPPAEKLVPADGVYAGLAVDESDPAGKSWPAAISIGTAPTFEIGERIIEAHLITDEAPELVGHALRLEFVRHLRPQHKFGQVSDLTAQIARDVAQTRELCHALDSRSGFAAPAPFCPRE